MARSRRPIARGLVVVSVATALLACPEERPEATKEIPPQRVPPAMSLEAPPSTPERGAAAPPDASPPPSAPLSGTASPSPAPAQPPAPPAHRR